MSRWCSLSLCVLAAALPRGVCAEAQEPTTTNTTKAGRAQVYATMNCIGIEWPITGDANHNATCQVEYRRQGAAAWKKALPLLHCDADRGNYFAGSLFPLDAGVGYEVRLSLSDPDGGQDKAELVVQTRPVPTPADGRTLHVIPGAGGGDGSKAAPFQGLKAAQAAAQPGDTFLLGQGKYGKFAFTKSGAPGHYICWKADGQGEASFAGVRVAASHLWLQGLTIRRADKDDSDGLGTDQGGLDVVISRNRFDGFHNAIKLGTGNREWYIADNEIRGDNDPVSGGLSGEGVELGKSRGHVVAHNRITRVADAVSYPGSDCDVFGNEIVDVSDDAVELDRGQQNNRVWGNRITNACNNVFSFQPMNRGPWYFLRNQVVLTRGKIWKFVTANDRFVALHNTFVFPRTASEYAQCLLNSFSRNNLYIAYGDESPMLRAAWNKRKGDGPGRTFVPDWMTDMDYDGFDWGKMVQPFYWSDRGFSDLNSLAQAVGIEKHGLTLRKEDLFEKWTTPVAQKETTLLLLSLKKGSRAVDAGAVLPGFNDDFVGRAPDLGALELGRPLPRYGPRE